METAHNLASNNVAIPSHSEEEKFAAAGQNSLYPRSREIRRKSLASPAKRPLANAFAPGSIVNQQHDTTTGWLKVKCGSDGHQWSDVYAICSDGMFCCLRQPGDTDPIYSIHLSSEWAVDSPSGRDNSQNYDQSDPNTGKTSCYFRIYKAHTPTEILESSLDAVNVSNSTALSKPYDLVASTITSTTILQSDQDNAAAVNLIRENGDSGCMVFASETPDTTDLWVEAVKHSLQVPNGRTASDVLEKGSNIIGEAGKEDSQNINEVEARNLVVSDAGSTPCRLKEPQSHTFEILKPLVPTPTVPIKTVAERPAKPASITDVPQRPFISSPRPHRSQSMHRRYSSIQGVMVGVGKWFSQPLSEWREVTIRNGMRILEEDSPSSATAPCLKSMTVINAPAEEIFQEVVNARNHKVWDSLMLQSQVVEKIDENSDIVYLAFRPVWIWPFWTYPRDLCVMRYWRKEEDGSYLLCMQSTEHRSCPPVTGYVRAHIIAGGYRIKPKRKQKADDPESTSCLVTHVLQMDPQGWIPRAFGFLHSYCSELMLRLIILRDYIDFRAFFDHSDQVYSDTAELPMMAPKEQTPNAVVQPEQTLSVFLAESSPEEEDDIYPASNPTLDGSIGMAVVIEPQGRKPGRSNAILSSVSPSPLKREYCRRMEASVFSIRGPLYLQDKVKCRSEESLLTLVATDLFEVEAKVDHIASFPTNRVQKANKENPSEPFTFVFQFQIPGSPQLSLVLYFQPTHFDEATSQKHGMKLWKSFLEADNEYRDTHFKIIPRVAEGNWVVKSAVGSTPALLGTKLKQTYYSDVNYFELDCDVGSSSVAQGVLRVVRSYVSQLVLDMAFLIEAKTSEDLPERVLGTARFDRLKLSDAIKFVSE